MNKVGILTIRLSISTCRKWSKKTLKDHWLATSSHYCSNSAMMQMMVFILCTLLVFLLSVVSADVSTREEGVALFKQGCGDLQKATRQVLCPVVATLRPVARHHWTDHHGATVNTLFLLFCLRTRPQTLWTRPCCLRRHCFCLQWPLLLLVRLMRLMQGCQKPWWSFFWQSFSAVGCSTNFGVGDPCVLPFNLGGEMYHRSPSKLWRSAECEWI